MWPDLTISVVEDDLNSGESFEKRDGSAMTLQAPRHHPYPEVGNDEQFRSALIHAQLSGEAHVLKGLSDWMLGHLDELENESIELFIVACSAFGNVELVQKVLRLSKTATPTLRVRADLMLELLQITQRSRMNKRTMFSELPLDVRFGAYNSLVTTIRHQKMVIETMMTHLEA